MKILVTGCNGFIGRYILQELSRRSCEIFGCGRTLEKNIHSNEGNVLWQYISCALFSFHEVKKVIKQVQPTHILHLAWYVGDNYWNIHYNIPWIEVTKNLMEVFVRYGGQRFIGVGTCAEYAPVTYLRKEDRTPTIPDTLYGKSKLTCYNFCRCLAEYYNINFAWCRPFFICGPNEPYNRFIPQACKAFNKEGIFLPQFPNRKLDYMDVRDVAAAISSVVFSDIQDAVNICTGKAISIREILLKIIAMIQYGKIDEKCSLSQCSRIIGCPKKLKSDTGFSPKYNINTTLYEYLINNNLNKI